MSYNVRIEVRTDLTGEIVDMFNVQTEYIGQSPAMRLAEAKAYRERNERYGIPVNFTAVKCKTIQPVH